MQIAPLLALVLLLAPLAPPEAPPAPAWADTAGPGGGPVQGVGGSLSVLVASTWGKGAFRSYDGGERWERIPGFPPVDEARVQFDPTDPDVGYVYGFGGVARTLDGGRTWDHVLDTFVSYRLAVSPTGALLASYRDDEHWTHVYRSFDRGVTWEDLGVLPDPWTSLYGLAFGATDDDVVAMSISRMWVTHDAGATWTTSEHTFLDLRRAPDGRLWAAGFETAVSEDSGDTWTLVATPARGWPMAVGADGRIFLRSFDGLLTSADGGATWDVLASGEATFGATSLLVDPSDPTAVFASDEFLGVVRVSSAGIESRSVGLPAVPVYALAAAADGSVALAGGPHGVYASRDGGATWHHTGAGMGFWGVWSVAASADGSVLYGGGRTRVFSPFLTASRDGGATWNVVDPELGGDGVVMGIATDPADPLRALAAATMDRTSSKLIETRDGGLTWSIVLDLPARIRDVAWDAAAGRALVATELGVLELVEGVPVLKGATFNTWTVAARDGRSWSNGPEVSIWSGARAPHAPWADSGAYVVDLAPEDATTVWAVNDGGALARCVEGACTDASAPAYANAALVLGGVALAGTENGIYRTIL